MKIPTQILTALLACLLAVTAHSSDQSRDTQLAQPSEISEAGSAYLAALATLAKDAGIAAEVVTAQGRSLLKMMPQSDHEVLTSESLLENHRLALQARAQFPWGPQLSEDLFVEHVLPYAALDETREEWRAEFYEICSRLVKGCKTASEAAQALNRGLFNELEVHYNTGRKKPNQSLSESRELKKATCTGLSIILNYGCRAVGIPSRIVGTPLWSDQSGNHTWVEIWDQEWLFLGADEYDAAGLNRGWFTDRAAQAKADEWQHAIWAVSWSEKDHHFPLVWNPRNKEIGAVNVTSRYLKEVEVVGVGVRVFEGDGGQRIPAKVTLRDGAGQVVAEVETRAGQTDLNDVARIEFKGEGPWSLLAEYKGRQMSREFAAKPVATFDLILADEAPLDVMKIRDEFYAIDRETREQELKKKVIRAAGKEMKFLEKSFGKKSKGGRSLWISLHGGGGAPAAVNERQWNNQIKLYRPSEGIYVAPRAPTDTWNLWHEKHIDELFDRLIANYVICRDVDPNRIYLLGYSAGGDGVYQLAPRMADRFAAASMMAGHPNDARPDNLLNLPFEIFMGEQDAAFQRNKKAAEWKTWLASFQEKEPQGYPHKVTIYPKLGHWMEGEDQEALPRMIKNTRVEWPKKVVWVQDDVTHERLYWLGVKPAGAKPGRKLVAEVDGQTIRVKGNQAKGLRLWLGPELLDLKQEVVVIRNGKEVFRGMVPESEEVVRRSLMDRQGMIATALLEIP